MEKITRWQLSARRHQKRSSNSFQPVPQTLLLCYILWTCCPVSLSPTYLRLSDTPLSAGLCWQQTRPAVLMGMLHTLNLVGMWRERRAGRHTHRWRRRKRKKERTETGRKVVDREVPGQCGCQDLQAVERPGLAEGTPWTSHLLIALYLLLGSVWEMSDKSKEASFEHLPQGAPVPRRGMLVLS